MKERRERAMGAVSLFCRTGKLKEAGLTFYSSLLMHLMNTSTPRKHSHYMGCKRHMFNAGKRFSNDAVSLFSKLGRKIYLLKSSILCKAN